MSDMKDPFQEFEHLIVKLVVAISTLATSGWLVYLLIAKVPEPVQVFMVIILVLGVSLFLIWLLSKWGDN